MFFVAFNDMRKKLDTRFPAVSISVTLSRVYFFVRYVWNSDFVVWILNWNKITFEFTLKHLQFLTSISVFGHDKFIRSYLIIIVNLYENLSNSCLCTISFAENVSCSWFIYNFIVIQELLLFKYAQS